jgi:linoleate 10R-lipoxygenase
MRVVEIMTIEQNRSWGTCTLNEFRKFFGLRPWKDFKEWNPDPEINVSNMIWLGKASSWCERC